MLQTLEEGQRLMERVDDQDLQDKGFGEDTMEGITVPVLYNPHHDVASPSSSHQPQLSISPDEPTLSAQHLSSVMVSQQTETESSSLNEAEVRHFTGPSFHFSLILFSIPNIHLHSLDSFHWTRCHSWLGQSLGSGFFVCEAPYLTDPQVTEAIRFWTALLDVNKKWVKYQPRHQPQLTHGCFKAPKRSRSRWCQKASDWVSSSVAKRQPLGSG